MSPSPYISFQPIRVLIDGHDSEGRLVLADDQLAAVIVRLDGDVHDATSRGLWHLEAGFGKCAAPPMAHRSGRSQKRRGSGFRHD